MRSSNMGITIKNYIDVENSSEVIVVKENIIYNEEDLPRYNEMFQQLYEDGDLVNKSFDDNIWITINENGTNRLYFDIETRTEINTALKCYVLIKVVGRNVTVLSGLSSLNSVKSSLLKSNYFCKDNLVDYRDSIPTWTDRQKQDLYSVREFLKFYNCSNSNEYLEVIEKVKIPKTKHRLLPNYRSILEFDVIIKNFIIDKVYEKEWKLYYPLVLWWKLTKILPLRPVEFSILNRNCCSFSEETNKYHITVERRKVKNGVIKFKQVPVLNTIEITKEIYDLFNDYAQLIDPKNQNDRLFTYESYSKSLNELKSQSPDLDTLESGFLTTYNLRYLLKKFYDNIVSQKFVVIEKSSDSDMMKDNEIQRIQFGDTRHIAICSMLLQGFNPLTIAMLAGHYTLREQMSYYGHLETFVDAHTYLLAKALKNKLLNNFDYVDIYNDYRKSLLDKEMLGNDFYKLRKVKGGRCKCSSFPKECILDECIFCLKYFVRDETLTEEMLSSMKSKVDKEILAKLDYIRNVCKGLTSDQNGNCSSQISEELKTQSNSLSTSTNKKAILLSYKLKLSEELNML